jgi:hypothetical protein
MVTIVLQQESGVMLSFVALCGVKDTSTSPWILEAADRLLGFSKPLIQRSHDVIRASTAFLWAFSQSVFSSPSINRSHWITPTFLFDFGQKRLLVSFRCYLWHPRQCKCIKRSFKRALVHFCGKIAKHKTIVQSCVGSRSNFQSDG